MSVTATRLQRVRVRCDGLDPTTARLRLDQLLASAELRPPGLPPAALLYVRRLSDPRPGTVAMGGGQVRPPPEWERAFVAALEQMMREATRPAHGPVPAGAEAVLFADRAELLACLARDVCEGTAWVKWWWRGMFDTAVAMRADHAVQRWLEEPEHVPAALELLAGWGAAVRFAQTVAPASALQLAGRVAEVFAARELRAALVAPLPVAENSSRVSDAAGQQALPGERFAPEATSQALLAEQALMVSTVLALRRGLSVARGRAFAEQVRRWRAAGAVSDSVPAADVATPTLAPPMPGAESGPIRPKWRPPPTRPRARRTTADSAASQPDPAAADQAGAAREPTVAVERTDSGSEPAKHVLHAGRDGHVTRAPTPHAAPIELPATSKRDPRPPQPRDDAPPEPSPPPTAIAPSTSGDRSQAGARSRLHAPAEAGTGPAVHPPSAPHEPTAVDTRDLALELDTELGGIFYLLNLALHLELYGDFTTPLQPGIRLDPWDFIELLGSWLLGRRVADPIWGLLARLAGRRGEPPGRGFRPPRGWRVSPAWLGPVACEGVWRWSAANRTLRILHPAGFPVAAVPRTTAAPAEQLRAELRRLPGRRPPLARATLSREPKHELARWVARFGAYARVRLARSLGLADPAGVTELLLAHRARVLVTPTHVDVRFALAELPLEIRFAGLDRTPGWIPAAGHFVAFDFV